MVIILFQILKGVTFSLICFIKLFWVNDESPCPWKPFYCHPCQHVKCKGTQAISGYLNVLLPGVNCIFEGRTGFRIFGIFRDFFGIFLIFFLICPNKCRGFFRVINAPFYCLFREDLQALFIELYKCI